MATVSGDSWLPGFPKEEQTVYTTANTDSLIAPTTVQVESTEELSEELSGFGITGTAVVTYALADALTEAASETVTLPPITVNLTPDTGQVIVEGSVMFHWAAGETFYDRNGKIYRSMDLQTGAGIECGTINYQTGEVVVTPSISNAAMETLTIDSLVTEVAPQYVTEAHFRTPGAPVRVASFYVQGTLIDGRSFNATADSSGVILGDFVQGGIDVETGIVNLYFGCSTTAGGEEGEEYYDAANIRDDGKLWVPIPVVANSVTYNCVVYSYLPLDADLIGIDPVRLPTDGRVAIINKGDAIVIHHTQTTILPVGIVADQVLSVGRDAVSLVELYDAEGTFIPSAGVFVADLSAGTITMDSDLDLSPYVEPLVAMNRREDMRLVNDVQITGQLTVTSPISHDYPAGETYVSAALPFGDLASRVVSIFDQKTWTDVWSDELIGDACVANYNTINYPITTTNAGAIAERWLLKFTSTTTFDVIGENVGVIAEDWPITSTLAPLNPATGEPYFTISPDGWGAGWATGNLVRFNTEAANHHIWVVRTTLSGTETEANDQFTIQIRGDAD